MPIVAMSAKVGNRQVVYGERIFVCDWPGCSSAHRIDGDETIVEAMAEAMRYGDGDAWLGMGAATEHGQFQHYLCGNHASVAFDEFETVLKKIDEMSDEEIENWITQGTWAVDGFGVTEPAFRASRIVPARASVEIKRGLLSKGMPYDVYRDLRDDIQAKMAAKGLGPDDIRFQVVIDSIGDRRRIRCYIDCGGETYGKMFWLDETEKNFAIVVDPVGRITSAPGLVRAPEPIY